MVMIYFFHSPIPTSPVPFHRIDEGQESLVKAFEGGKGREKDRCIVTKDLGIQSIGTL